MLAALFLRKRRVVSIGVYAAKNEVKMITGELRADIEALIDEKIKGVLGGAVTPPEAELRPETWDFKVEKANDYPGNGWIFVAALNVQPGYIGILWRKSRIDLAAEHKEPVMKPK